MVNKGLHLLLALYHLYLAQDGLLLCRGTAGKENPSLIVLYEGHAKAYRQFAKIHCNHPLLGNRVWRKRRDMRAGRI